MILDAGAFGLWSAVVKRAFRAVFVRPSPGEALRSIASTLRDREAAAYIHVPFCTGTCTFCPYVRYPLARSEVERIIGKYVDALIREMRLYSGIVKELGLRVVDIHAGGGTPSLVPPRLWRRILEEASSLLGAEPRAAIEANPEDLRDEGRAYSLVDSGIDEVSLGVQSFDARILRTLGRRHGPEDAVRAVENLRGAGCRYINIDLMYMVPGQSPYDWARDLEAAAGLDVDEVTCYPTLVARHSRGYELMRRGIIPQQPDGKAFREMVYLCEDVLPARGFRGVEIYGYSRVEGWKYFTVNYEMEGPLLGLGCGAMGFTGGYEYQNTCFVDEYVEAVSRGRLPIAGSRGVDRVERAIRYVVCRLFVCRELDKGGFESRFGESFDELVGRTGFGRALRLLRFLGVISERGGRLRLTKKGLFTAHKICWAFVLNVPCRIAEEFMREPWPERVVVP